MCKLNFLCGDINVDHFYFKNDVLKKHIIRQKQSMVGARAWVHPLVCALSDAHIRGECVPILTQRARKEHF